MALRNVPITPGSGDNVQFDDAEQVVKTSYGAAGSHNLMDEKPATAAKQTSLEAKIDALLAALSPAPGAYPPGYGATPAVALPPTVDEGGYTSIRGPVLTDEGGYRDNFAGSSLAIGIGTCTFTNGSDVVTGTGFDLVDLQVGCYVYLNADGASAARQVSSFTATEITLKALYGGTGGTGAASRQIEKSTVGAGGSITVSGGQCTITCGTTATSVFELERDVDILPLAREGRFSISQRIANQDIYFGFHEEANPTRWYYQFHFTGTNNTVVNCVCAWNPTGTPSGGEISTQTITLPASVTTAASNTYRVEVLKDRVFFYINEILVATERRVVAHPNDKLNSTLQIVNGTTPASSTSVVVDYITCSNFNVVSTENPSQNMTITNPNVPAQEVLAYNVGGVIAINTDLGIFDASQFRAFSVQCVSMGTTGVVTPAASFDGGTTWNTIGIFPVGGGAVATTFNAAGAWIMPGLGALIRLRLTTATTAGTTTIRVRGMHQVPFFLTNNTTVTGSVTATGVAGAAAHDAAVSGNPVRTAGRALTAAYTTVATGDTADYITTLQGVQITKQYQIPELENIVTDRITNSTTAVQIKALAASLKQYVTSFTIKTATLGGSSDFQLRSTPVASTTATIASNTLVMAATYNWKVGDLVYVTASTVTGLTAGNYYYLLTVSGANLTFATTRGGSTLAISGTTVSATLAKVLHRVGLDTAAAVLPFSMPNPADTGTGLALEAVTLTAVTGNVDILISSYTAP
jgi:hypothetical protein